MWTRAAPLLTFAFAGGLLGAIQLDRPLLAARAEHLERRAAGGG